MNEWKEASAGANKSYLHKFVPKGSLVWFLVLTVAGSTIEKIHSQSIFWMVPIQILSKYLHNKMFSIKIDSLEIAEICIDVGEWLKFESLGQFGIWNRWSVLVSTRLHVTQQGTKTLFLFKNFNRNTAYYLSWKNGNNWNSSLGDPKTSLEVEQKISARV